MLNNKYNNPHSLLHAINDRLRNISKKEEIEKIGVINYRHRRSMMGV